MTATLIVGPVTSDVFDGRVEPGGAVRFAARVATAFGVRGRLLVLGAAGEGCAAFAGHERRSVECGETLTFRHHLDNGMRSLELMARPDCALAADAVPSAWARPDLLLLAPLLPADIELASFAALEPRAVALLAQGLVREVGDDGRVRNLLRLPERLLAAVEARTSVFLSQDEVAGWPGGDLEALTARARRVVITRGDRGAEIRSHGGRFHVEPVAAQPVDPTGAGDVFAAAFALALATGVAEDELAAARLASVYAAADIEAVGAPPLPSLTEAQRRVAGTYGAGARGEVTR